MRYYLRNGQGDIVKLIDGSGNTVVEYAYDSWGKPLSCTGTLATTLGALNPFRYRGYVYDEETGLYYLKSRYYDPETCRFISADVLLSTGQGVLGHDVYVYCLNSPVDMIDLLGYGGEDVYPQPTPSPDDSSESKATPSAKVLSTPQPGPGPMLFMPKRNVNTKEVDARLFERLRNMAEYYDVHLIIITSGYRTHEAQRNLYYGYIEGKEGYNYAMPPKTSWHEYGGAIDISCSVLQRLANEDFERFGLSRPAYVPNDNNRNETWHIQLLENNTLSTNYDFGTAYFYSITWWGKNGE